LAGIGFRFSSQRSQLKVTKAFTLHMSEKFRCHFLCLSISLFPFNTLDKLIQKPRINLGGSKNLVYTQPGLESSLDLEWSVWRRTPQSQQK
tara:strand:+ start:1206 stop:1478 length:273 start_codon:yes stop_codon:yes gene_type:complete